MWSVPSTALSLLLSALFSSPVAAAFHVEEVQWHRSSINSDSSTRLFHHHYGGDTPPRAAMIAAFPDLAYDSYLTLDGEGPSSGERTAKAPRVCETVDGQAWPCGRVMPEGGCAVSSGLAPSGRDGIFIARMTASGALPPVEVHVTLAEREGPVLLRVNGDPVPSRTGERYQAVAHVVSSGSCGLTRDIWVEQVTGSGVAPEVIGTGFQIEEELLSPQSTAVSTEAATLVDHAVTGDDDRDAVHAVRAAGSPTATGAADG